MKTADKNSWRKILLTGTGRCTSSFSNSIGSAKYSPLSFVFLHSLESFQNPFLLWIIGIFIFEVLVTDPSLRPSILETSLMALYIGLLVLRDLLFDLPLQRHDFRLNNRVYSCWTGEAFKPIKSKNICPGHIIRLDLQESAPADILLISACGNNKKVFFNEVGKPGELTQKQCVDVTHDFIFNLELNKLEGVVKVKPPADYFCPFRGILQLKSDYKEHTLLPKNFVSNGSVLKASSFVLGLVLYTGHESKIFNNVLTKRSKKSKFRKTLNAFVGSLIVLYLAVTFLCVLLRNLYISGNSVQIESETLAVLFVYNKTIVPLTCFITYEVIKILQVLILSFKYKVTFHTPGLISELGQVEYCVISKETLTLSQDLEVSECILEGKVYSRNPKLNEHPSSPAPETVYIQRIDPELNNNLVKDETYNFEELLNQEFSEDLTKSIALSSIFETHHEHVYSYSSEEVSLARFAESLGCLLTSRTPTHCELAYNSDHFTYSILGFQEFSKNNKYSSVVAMDDKEQTTLFVKGKLKNIQNYLAYTFAGGSKRYINHEKKLRQSGLKTIVIARKLLTPAERDCFMNAYDSIVYGNSHIKYMKVNLFEEYLKDLKPLCILGIKTSVNKESAKLSHAFENSMIKTWIVSPDSSSAILKTARIAGFLQENLPVHKLHNIKSKTKCQNALYELYEKHILKAPQENYADITRNVIENQNKSFEGIQISDLISKDDICLRNISEGQFNSHNVRYAIAIDSVSLDTALAKEKSKKMLVSLMFASACVCFSGLDPSRKKSVVNLLKKNLQFKPSVVAIGNDLGDLPMLKEANIGICCSNEKLEAFSDISVKNLRDARKLIVSEGYFIYARLSRTILGLLFVKLTLFAINFYFLFVNSFSGTLLLKESNTMSLAEGSVLPSFFFLGLFDKNSRLFSEIPWVYFQGIYSNLFSQGRLLTEGAKSLILGTLIFGVLYLSFPYIIHESGNESSLEYLSMIVLMVSFIVFQFEVFMKFSKTSFGAILSGVISVLLMIFSFTLAASGLIFEGEYLGVQEFMLLPLTIVIVAGASLLCITIRLGYYYFVQIFNKNSNAKNRLEDFSDGLSKAYKRSKTHKDYKEGSLEMSPWTLLFYNKDVEKLYQQYQGKKALRNYRLILLICFIGLGIAMIESLVFGYDETKIMPYTIILAMISILIFSSVIKTYRKYILRFNLFALVLSRVLLIILRASDLNLFVAYAFPSLSFYLSGLKFASLFISNIINLLLYTLSIFLIEDDLLSSKEATETLILLTYLSYIYIIVKYGTEKTYRTNFALELTTKNTRSRNNSILKSLLPLFVLSRVKSGIRYISEDKGTVTVMFCYICDFERINDKYSSSEISAFLNSLFNQFDLICRSTGVTKIETVGNTYMACSGLKDSEENSEFKHISQGIRAVQAGLNMLKYCKNIKLKDGSYLKVKIGINTGPVTAGVVGYHKPQFSLVGDTVNTASRLCSTALPFQVQICPKTHSMVKDREDWHFEEHHVNAKGLGIIQTFLVNQIAMSALILHTASQYDFFNSFQTTDSKRSQQSYSVKVIGNPCKQSKFYKEYRESYLKDNKTKILMVHVGLILFLTLLFITQKYDSGFFSFEGVLYLIQIFLTILVAIVFKYFYRCSIAKIIFFLLSLLLDTLRDDDPEYYAKIYVLDFLKITILIIYGYGVDFLSGLVLSVVFLIGFIFKMREDSSSFYSNDFLFMMIFYAITVYSAYTIERKRILQAHFQKRYQEEVDISEQLLQNLIPKWVLSDLNTDNEINDKITAVTLLYADIVGFTAYSNNRTPSEVIEMLSLLFTRFDKLCLTFNVYKVYTIGDCYVVMGCTDKLNRNNAQECLNVVDMAIGMIDIINQVNSEFGSNLNMRIGIHTGDISGAITGTTIVRYDIYGTNVAVANKMESEGKPGRIKVSDTTKELLQCTERDFGFEYDGKVELKSIEKSHDSYMLVYDRS